MAKKAVKKEPKVKILPRKMSSLVRIALADIRKAEADDNCVVNMGIWLEKKHALCTINAGMDVIKEHEVCVMCAAGAVMAFTLGVLHSPKQWDARSPSSFDGNEDQLCALDSLRLGDVWGAAGELGLYKTDECGEVTPAIEKKFGNLNMPIPEYERHDPEPFHRAMNKLHAKLVKRGL